MTISEIREKGLLLFECISGSRAYGTDLPGSDTDLKGVFYLPEDAFYGMGYVPQVSSERNDEVYYELGRFAELLSVNNPAIMEMLATPEDCLLYCHPDFKDFLSTSFLSKRCKETFSGFALTQIKRAKGLNKKINYSSPPERKTPLDFCYVPHLQGTESLIQWLEHRNFKQENCGLVKLPNMRDTYGLYYDESGLLGYSGIIRGASSNELALSVVASGALPKAILSYNQDAYSIHCKEVRQYEEWVAHRNETRYQGTMEHGRQYDAKNMMHTFRLLDMAAEILEFGKVVVRRPNRAYLLDIRAGKFEYDTLLAEVEKRLEYIAEVTARSPLPDVPDVQKIENLLIALRRKLYGGQAKTTR